MRVSIVLFSAIFISRLCMYYSYKVIPIEHLQSTRLSTRSSTCIIHLINQSMKCLSHFWVVIKNLNPSAPKIVLGGKCSQGAHFSEKETEAWRRNGPCSTRVELTGKAKLRAPVLWWVEGWPPYLHSHSPLMGEYYSRVSVLIRSGGHGDVR